MSRPADSPPGHAGPEPSASFWDVLRWVLAAVVAVVAAVFFFYGVGHQSVCHQQPSAAGATTLVQVCGPPGLLELVPFALVIATLLWPDLGELAVAGLFTLRRRITEQEERQRGVESRLLAVDQQLTQLATLSQSQAQTAIGSVHHYFAADQDELKNNIETKEAAGAGSVAGSRRPGSEVGPIQPAARTDDRETPRLLGEFLLEYSRLERYLAPSGSRLGAEVEDLDHERRALVEDWRVMFRPEIAALRQTRNAIVHRPESVPADTLRGAIDNTRELARILFGRIE